MAQQYGGGRTPQQQKQFSDWWLNEKYGGDLNNVEGLYQNETTGAWQADPNTVFDINPETGQKGQFKYMATPAFTGWIDVTEPLFYTISNADGSTFEVEMTRNRHGLYAPEEFLDSSGQRIVFNTNPNTGEEGKWVWLGTMGWTNTEGDPQPEPEPGTIVFNPGGDQIAGPYDPNYDPDDPDSVYTPPETPVDSVIAPPPPENPFDDAGVTGLGGSSGPAFSASAPVGLEYAAPAPLPLFNMPQASAAPKVDYAKVMNDLLMADVFGGMMTGRKV